MSIPSDLYHRIVTAKLFIDENYQKPINLNHISKEACLSPFHFHRLFSTIYKKTPHQYVRLKRIEKAKTLLEANKQVSDVCLEVGFESIGSFSSLFKKQTGIPPQDYRSTAINKKQKTVEQPQTVIPNCFIAQLNR